MALETCEVLIQSQLCGFAHAIPQPSLAAFGFADHLGEELSGGRLVAGQRHALTGRQSWYPLAVPLAGTLFLFFGAGRALRDTLAIQDVVGNPRADEMGHTMRLLR